MIKLLPVKNFKVNMLNNKPYLAVITGGGANFYSLEMALQRLGVTYQLTSDRSIIENSSGAIFPGVGSAGFAMAELMRLNLIEVIRNYKRPLLGICLGMQLLYEYSEEGDVSCLGILPGMVKRFDNNGGLIVPHMGWNGLLWYKDTPLANEIDRERDVYFVHSFFAPVNEATVASCNYGCQFAAIAQQDNFYAMQFHPEKSGMIGEQLLKNFIGVIDDNLSGN